MSNLLKAAVVAGIFITAGGGPLLLPALSFWPHLALSGVIGIAWAPIVFFFACLLCELCAVANNWQFTDGKYALLPYVFFAAGGSVMAVSVMPTFIGYGSILFLLAFAGILVLVLSKDDIAKEGVRTLIK